MHSPRTSACKDKTIIKSGFSPYPICFCFFTNKRDWLQADVVLHGSKLILSFMGKCNPKAYKKHKINVNKDLSFITLCPVICQLLSWFVDSVFLAGRLTLWKAEWIHSSPNLFYGTKREDWVRYTLAHSGGWAGKITTSSRQVWAIL